MVDCPHDRHGLNPKAEAQKVASNPLPSGGVERLSDKGSVRNQGLGNCISKNTGT